MSVSISMSALTVDFVAVAQATTKGLNKGAHPN